jgi:hypothetical protein
VANDDSFLGAVASGAGDDFHEQWVARELLRLLDPDSDVVSIKVEGLPIGEAHAQLGKHAQAVDVTLTKQRDGDRTYQYLQLKYSPSNPGSTWTWSRLTTPTTKSKPLSGVLGKLAQLMLGVDFAGEFAIVTNQPLDPSVANDIASILGGAKPPIMTNLKVSLGLDGAQLLRFLRAWDLAAFATVPRLILQTEIVERLAETIDGDAASDARQLQYAIKQLMLPEGRRVGELTRKTLLIWLGAGAEEIFFPAESRITTPGRLLQRKVAGDLADRLRAPAPRPVRIRADGGCGKTALISTLSLALPVGSEVLVYDCYGGGLFLASDEKRHLPSRAFTQTANELAARLFTPFVVRRDNSANIFSAFRRRVAAAAEIIAARGPEALLVLCFDAVDNARIGAGHWKEPCFLDDLAAASSWPANVRILVSCRNARVDQVGAAELYDDFPVPVFEPSETENLVQLWHPSWNPHVAHELHDLTGGNPRRLVYAIEGVAEGDSQLAIQRLLPRATGIDPLFEKRVEEAGVRLGGERRVWPMLSALARLPRPVPAHALAAIAELQQGDVLDIANDVGGIVEHPNGWSFHDEDFEAFVDERTKADAPELLDRAADILAALAPQDGYAALALAEVLVSSDRLDELFALVTGQLPLPQSLSEGEKQFVHSQRLALALRACRRAGDIGTACSLLIASAEAIKRQQLIDDVVADNLDLAVRFERDAAMRLVMTGRRHRKHRAALRVELAAAIAGEDPGEARVHLRWWQEYLADNRIAQPDKRIEVGATDIAAENRAVAALRGDAAAFDRLFEWHPGKIYGPVFRLLVQAEAGARAEPLIAAIDRRNWIPTMLAPLLAAALLAGATFDDPVIVRALGRLAAAKSTRWRRYVDHDLGPLHPLSWHEATLFVCERAVKHPSLHASVATILDRALPLPAIREEREFYQLRSQGALLARAIALREIVSGKSFIVTEWLPPEKVVPKVKGPRASRRTGYLPPKVEKSTKQRFNETRAETLLVFGKLLGGTRAIRALLLGDVKPPQGWEDFKKAFTHASTHDSRPRESDAAVAIVRTFLLHAALGGLDLVPLRGAAIKLLKSWFAANTKAELGIASALLLTPNGYNLALAWLVALGEDVQRDALPASERAKLLASFARVALPVDPALAAVFFADAITATAKVDFEALSELAACRAVAEAGLGGKRAERAALATRLGDAAGAVVAALDFAGDFAWDRMAAAMGAADLPTALAAITRWHDIGIVRFENTMSALLESSAAAKLTIVQRYALGLLGDADGPRLSEILPDEQIPELINSHALRSRLLDNDLSALSQAIETLSDLPGAGASLSIAEAKGYHATLIGWEKPVRQMSSSPPDPSTLLPLSSRDAIAAELESVRGAERPIGYRYFNDVASRVRSLALRVPFLELAIAAAEGKGDLGFALPEILEEWGSYPPVREWARTRLPVYITGALRNLFHYRYEETEALEDLLTATGLNSIEQGELILDAVAQNGETMTAELIFAMVGVVAARTPSEIRNTLLDDLLGRVRERADRPPELSLDGLDAPDDLPACVARLLFTAMADVDRRIRWRASHAALLLVEAGDPATSALVSLLAATDDGSFAAADFYRHAAREQLMAVLWRASASTSQAVAPFAGAILAALRADPHLIVRELGRSLLLDLHRGGEITLPAEDSVFVENLNRSRFKRIDRNDRSLRPAAFHKEEKKRPFHFDTMDTIRYWYERPAGLFGLDMESFLDLAEAWVHGRWGYGEETSHWIREPRLRRIQQEERHVSNRHGGRPMVERLSTYLEWTAMMLVVGELIETHPLVRERWGDDFLHWLARSMPTIGPWWLSDLRTVPPLEPRFWGHAAAGDVPEPDGNAPEEDQWPKSVVDEVFDQEISASGGSLLIAGDYQILWHERIQTVDVRSALVTPETAAALGQALHTALDRMDFILPGVDEHDRAIEVEGFELLPWLRYEDRDARSDRDDEARGSVAGVPITPMSRWIDSDALLFDRSRSAWVGPDGRPEISLDAWGDEEKKESSGWRAIADPAFLADLLERAGKTLIVHVEISRRRTYSDHSKTYWRLYLLDQKGELRRVERMKRGLGPILLRRENLAYTVDTYSRWLVHRIAELDAQRSAAAGGKAERLQSEIERLCRIFRQRKTANHW